MKALRGVNLLVHKQDRLDRSGHTTWSEFGGRSRPGGEGWLWQQADSACQRNTATALESSALVLRPSAGVADSPLQRSAFCAACLQVVMPRRSTVGVSVW
jgi:hypothetical protein